MPKEYGKPEVDELLAEREVPEQNITKEQMDAYLANVLNNPITVEDATKLALYRNPDIQKSYANLGFSAANLYSAGRIRNPFLTLSYLSTSDTGFSDLTTFGFGFSISDIIKLPSNLKTAKKNYKAAKLAAAAKILDAIRDVQVAYYAYVSAKQISHANDEFYTALNASAEFDRNDFEFGLITSRELLELNVVVAEAKFNAIQAQNDEIEARRVFANLLGLSINDSWNIPDNFTIPADNELNLNKLTETANEASLQLASQRTKIEELQEEVDIASWEPYVGDIQIGIEREKNALGAKLTGPQIDVEIPLWDHHHDETAIAISNLRIALANLEQSATEIQNNVSYNFEKTKNAKVVIDDYREHLMPLRAEIVERARNHENYILQGIFDIYDTNYNEYQAYIEFSQIILEYWVSFTNLRHAVGDSISYPAQQNIEIIPLQDLFSD